MRASPVRSRRRSRYRHNNSPVSTSTTSLVSILKSPVKHSIDTAVVKIQSNPVADGSCHDNVAVTPGSRLRLNGPGKAIHNVTADQRCCSDGCSCMLVTETAHNLNDVCFGCDGNCNDPACTSKKNEKPKMRHHTDSIRDMLLVGQTVSPQAGQSKLNRVSNPSDVNASEIEDSENGNTQSSNSPAKVMPELTSRGQVSPQILSSKLKRLCSNGDGESHTKNSRPRTEMSSGRVRNVSFL